jgi:hypothetical protein
MKSVVVPVIFFASILAVSTHACSARGAHGRKSASAQTSCAGAQKALTRVQQGDPAAINSAIQHLQCYEGSQAEDAEVAIGDLIISYPHRVFSSIHTNKLSSSEVAAIASSMPWRFVDNFCGLKSELVKRLSVIRSLNGFRRERAISMKAIMEFLEEVAPHCEEIRKK